MKIGLIGDLHNDKSRIVNVLGSVAVSVMVGYVDKLINFLVKEGCERIVFLGDVGDQPSLSDESELALLKLFHKWDGKTKIDIITGNHDIEQETVHSLCKLKWMADTVWKTISIHTEYTVLDWDGRTIEMLPFPLKKGKKKNSICFGHFDRAGAVGDNGYKVRGGVEAEKSSRVYVLGHLHTPQSVGSSHFVGSPYQTSFGESEEKGVGIIDTDTLKYKFIPKKPPFLLLNFEVSEQEDLSEISDNLLIKYKLFYNSDKVKIPSNFMLEHPNVVDIVPYNGKSKVDLKTMMNPEIIEFDIQSNLPKYLVDKGLNKKQVARAQKLVAKAIKSL